MTWNDAKLSVRLNFNSKFKTLNILSEAGQFRCFSSPKEERPLCCRAASFAFICFPPSARISDKAKAFSLSLLIAVNSIIKTLIRFQAAEESNDH